MDSITALAAATLLMLANGTVLALVRKHLTPNLQLFAYRWQAATFTIAAGCLIFPFHRYLPVELASPVANGPLLVGLAGYWHALRQLYGKPLMVNWLAVAVVATMLGLLWFSAVQPNIKVRIMLVSAAWLLFMGGSFFTLKSALSRDTTRTHGILLGIFGMVTLFTAVRAVYYAIFDIHLGFDIIDNSSLMNLLTPMIAVVLPVIGTTAFILLLLERMRNEAAALQSSQTDSKNLEQLSYLGHDLRAPLSTIVGYARLLSETQTDEQAGHLRAIERSASYQMALIDEMLEQAKRQLQPLEMRFEPTDVATLLEDIIQHGRSLSSQQHNRFEFTAPTVLPERIQGDPRRLQQILLNLIANAAKFTQKGHIRFMVTAEPGSNDQCVLTFKVSDTGSGIHPQDQQAIFQAFEQREARPGSVGLGLYIARTAIRNMGGELLLESTPGKGSTFTVDLPTLSLSTKTIKLPTQVWESSPILHADTATPSNPTADALQTLACLAANGEISKIEHWLEAQTIEQPDHAKFYDEVRLALDRLDLTHIEVLAGLQA